MSVCNGMGGCGCTIYLSSILCFADYCTFIYKDYNSDSSADAEIVLIIFHNVCTAPLRNIE